MFKLRDAETTYDRDTNGLIYRAGASWQETRPGFESLFQACAVSSVFLAGAGGLWAMAAGEANPVLMFGLVGLLFSAGLLSYTAKPERALYFLFDGRMMTPFGIFHRKSLQSIGGSHAHLVSIEARMQRDQPNENWEKMFEVILISNGGDLIVLSRNMPEWLALKVAAQLTHALNNLRRDRGPGDGAWAEVA